MRAHGQDPIEAILVILNPKTSEGRSGDVVNDYLGIHIYATPALSEAEVVLRILIANQILTKPPCPADPLPSIDSECNGVHFH
jgi:hypothetical protein